jgi:hypothetical protein
LKLFFCQKLEDDWGGGLLIVASDRERAEALFKEHQWSASPDSPYSIEEIDMTKEGVVYEDTSR